LNTNLKTRIDELAEKSQGMSRIPVVRAYSAIFRTFDIVDNYIRLSLQDDEVSRAGKSILHILIEHGGSMTATEISRHAWRSKFATIKVIDTLEREGFVTRAIPEINADRRKKMITITEKGVDLFEKTLKKTLETLCYQVLEGLTEEQIKQCFQLLEHIGQHSFELLKPFNTAFVYRNQPPDTKAKTG
jgi:DNA-binding MarR family transcriptional regulator